MSRLAIYGFEAGDTVGGANLLVEGGDATYQGAAAVQSAVKRTGTYALRVNPTTTGIGSIRLYNQSDASWRSTSLTFFIATAYIRFYVRVATAPSSYEQVAVANSDAATLKASIMAQSSGAGFILRVKDAGGTNYDNSTVLNLNQWYRVELVVGTSATVATLTLYVDGVQWMNTATANTTATVNGYVTLGKETNTNGQGVDFYYDDVAVDNSTLPGPGSVVMLYPNASGTDQAWTATGAGTHPGSVDDWNRQEGDDVDTTYLLESASGTQAEENHCLNFTGNFSAQSISCLLAVLVQRNASGSANVGTPRLRSASTNSDGVAYDPGATYTNRFKLFLLDPATSAAWTASGLDSVQIGFVKTQSQARAMRMTASAVMVEYLPSSAGRSFGSMIC